MGSVSPSVCPLRLLSALLSTSSFPSTTIMKCMSLAAAALTFALPAFAQMTESLTYNTEYDDPDISLIGVACSDGVYGLMTQGYTTFRSLPGFPYIGGADVVTGWDSPNCGTCYGVTYYSPETETNTTIPILIVDTAVDGFVVSEEAMNALTGGLAVELGRVQVTVVEVAKTVCSLPLTTPLDTLVRVHHVRSLTRTNDCS